MCHIIEHALSKIKTIKWDRLIYIGRATSSKFQTYFPFHIVQITNIWIFSVNTVRKKSETVTEFFTCFVVDKNIKNSF